MLANLAWNNENPQALLKSAKEIFYDDKEEMYAGNIIVELIRSLHIGHSKKEALSGHFGNIFAQMKASWQWKVSKPTDGLLTYLMRAWYCFETAWDFTSAIHNAARWPDVDRHLLCSLTGALAEAMYGCEYRLLKEKYGSNWYNRITDRKENGQCLSRTGHYLPTACDKVRRQIQFAVNLLYLHR